MMDSGDGGGFMFNFGAAPATVSTTPPAGNSGTTLKACEEVFPSEESVQKIEPEEHWLSESVCIMKGKIGTREASDLLSVEEIVVNDLLPGVYEGGFKLWEGSDDLARHLMADWGISCSPSSPEFEPPPAILGKKVLELGCGHGLPGVLAAAAGASEVHFADFNAEVLSTLTAHNLRATLKSLPHGRSHLHARFFSGDWLRVCETLRDQGHSYDVILTAETTYSAESSARLLEALELLIPPGSPCVAFVAAKTYYFGVGGGAQQFRKLVADSDGGLTCEQVCVMEDGASNKREVLRLSQCR